MRIAKASDKDVHELIDFFKRKEDRGTKTPTGWRRVVWGFVTLRDNCADHTEDHLEFCPYLKGHVSPEQ